MPNRMRVAKTLVEDVLGFQQWDGLLGETVNMPTDAYDAVEEAMEAIVERVAQTVDWPRLLEEAVMRHALLHDDMEPDKGRITTKDVCGDCLREALLQDRVGAPAWHETESTPLRLQKTDWPTVVADNRKWRDVAHRHPYSD